MRSAKHLSSISNPGGTLLDFNPPDYREFIKAQKEMWDLRSRPKVSPPAATSAESSVQRPGRRLPILDARGVYRDRGWPFPQGYQLPDETIDGSGHLYRVLRAHGFCGIGRRIGFIGTFLLALVVTPLVVLPILLITGPSRHMEWRRRP